MLALLYDIHGNLTALDAVLADARDAGADRFLLGGDYALFGPEPAETVAALRAVDGATWIRGNVDRWCARPDQAPDDALIRAAIEDCASALGADMVEDLNELPEQLVLDDVRYCHASPLSDLESFPPAAVEDDERLLAGAGERSVVFGHTHLQFTRTSPGGIELVNPGSVGLPLDGDRRAAYALMRDGGSLELRRVEYDTERALAALQKRSGEAGWAQRSIRRLRSAAMVE